MSLGWAAMVLAAAALVHDIPGSRAWLLRAALAVGLAAAALTAGVGHAEPLRLARDATATFSPELLQLVLGLCLLGAGAALAGSRQWPAILAALVVVVAVWPLAALAGWMRSLGAGAGVLALALLGAGALRVLRPGRVLDALDRALLDRQGRAAWRPPADWMPTAPLLVLALCAAAALAVPHLVAGIGGPVLALVVAWRCDRRRWVLPLTAAVLLLALIGSLHLAGPLGGWIPGLIDGPFAPRAERWLALLAALGVVGVAGLWPVHGATVPVLLAPLAIAVGGLWAARLLPDGVAYWQPLFAPLAVLAAVHAGRRRRWPVLLVASGAFGLWTGREAGLLGGSVLIGAGWLLAVLPTTWLGRLPVPPVMARLAWLVPAGGALGVLEAGIGTEVTYTVLLTAAAGYLAATAPDAPPPVSSELPTPP